MDVKMNVKKRREKRIRQLTLGELAKGQAFGEADLQPAWRAEQTAGSQREQRLPQLEQRNQEEPDPELLWKRGQGRWNEVNDSGRENPDIPGHGRPTYWTRLLLRIGISAVLFLSIWGMNRFEPEWAFPIRVFVAEALSTEMDLSAAEAWYEQMFGGAPSFIPIFQHTGEKGVKVGSSAGFIAPIEGTLAGPFALSLKGVEIVPVSDSLLGEQVKVVETGRVLSVNEDALTGITVTVQHAKGYESLYGRLKQALVGKGDWVEIGDSIGVLEGSGNSVPPTLYFALKKDGLYIDPADVIPLD